MSEAVGIMLLVGIVVVGIASIGLDASAIKKELRKLNDTMSKIYNLMQKGGE